MRVTVLCANLGTNCIMRAALLAELLRDEFEARLAGIQAGGGLWLPALDLPVSVDAVSVRSAFRLGARAPGAGRLSAMPMRPDGRIIASLPNVGHWSTP